MIEFGFLFWVFLAGMIVATFQDLKRREVDNWLNFLLLAIGIVFVLYTALFENDFSIVIQLGFSVLIVGALMNIFYYGRVFAGGDAKLLLSLSAFFVGRTFFDTTSNIVIFVLLLMFSGSLYGLGYSFVLYFKDFSKVNKEIKINFNKKLIKYPFILNSCLLISGFIFYLFSKNYLPLVFSSLLFMLPVLFLFSKSLEKISFTRIISGKELREGDWLVKDVLIGKKKIKSKWEGLTEGEIKLLRNKKRIEIKEGLPFVPAFLIAFLLYVFSRNFLISIIGIF